MKILAYEVRPDERTELQKQADLLGVELEMTAVAPSPKNVHLACGCDGVSTLGQGRLDGAFLELLKNRALAISLPELWATIILIWQRRGNWDCGYAIVGMPPMALRILPLC